MEISLYLKYINFTINHKDESLQLARLAHSFIHAENSSQLSGPVLPKARKYSLLKADKDLQFADNHALYFFYLLDCISKSSQSFQSESDWVVFLKSINEPMYSSIRNKVGYQYTSIVLLIINRIYKINIPRHILEKKFNSRTIAHAFWDSLPYMEATNEELVDALFEATQGITAEQNYFNLNGAIRLCAKNNPDFAKLLIQKSTGSIERLKLFCPFSFSGLTNTLGLRSTIAILKEFLHSTEPEHQKVALRSLAMLHGNDDNPREAEDVFLPILEDIESQGKDEVIAELIFLYGLLINKLSISRQKLKDIPKNHAGKDCFFALALTIARTIKEEIGHEWLTEGLNILSNLSGQHVAIYSQLDFAFHQISNTHTNLVYQYFETFITNTANDLSALQAFDQVFSDLANNDIDLLKHWLTTCLNSNNPRFHKGVSKVLSHLPEKMMLQISLNETTINNLTQHDIEYILYKIVGYIYSKEQMERLVYSALLYNGNTQFLEKLVIELFCFYIIYNYPSSLDYLKSQKATANEAQKRVTDTVEQHFEQIYSSKNKKPKEVSPSPERLQLLFGQKTKEISDLTARSPFQKPSFLDIISKVSVKTGHNLFSRDDHSYGTKTRYGNKSSMGRISHTFEVPGGEFIDPIGQEYDRYLWRTFKRRK